MGGGWGTRKQEKNGGGLGRRREKGLFDRLTKSLITNMQIPWHEQTFGKPGFYRILRVKQLKHLFPLEEL